MDGIIISQTAALRHHLGLGERDGMPKSSTPPNIQPLFFVERSPGRLAKCKLASCHNSIGCGQYRIALHPGMTSPANGASKKAGEPQTDLCALNGSPW
jgi:hypothetical protein